MRVRRRRVACGVAAASAAVVLVPGCSAGTGTSTTTPTSTASSTTTTTGTGTGTGTSTTAVASPPATATPRIVKWIDLAVGDCLAALPPVDQSEVTVTVVDCATPHAAETYLRQPIKVNTAVADVANQQCATGLSQYIGHSGSNAPFSVTYLIDSNQDRTSNNPYPSAVICLLQSANGAPLTGSARG